MLYRTVRTRSTLLLLSVRTIKNGSIVTAQVDETGSLNFNPVMIDMNNAHAFNLNRVQVRLLTSASNQVSIEAASIVVVLSS